MIPQPKGIPGKRKKASSVRVVKSIQRSNMSTTEKDDAENFITDVFMRLDLIEDAQELHNKKMTIGEVMCHNYLNPFNIIKVAFRLKERILRFVAGSEDVLDTYF